MASKMQDRLAAQKQKSLEKSLASASALLPGEHVRYFIGVRTGLSPKIAGPHWGFDLTLLGLPFWHARVIVVTDKSVVICKAKGKFDASTPKEVLCRLPGTPASARCSQRAGCGATSRSATSGCGSPCPSASSSSGQTRN